MATMESSSNPKNSNQKENNKVKEKLNQKRRHDDECPECKSKLIVQWSGVKCSNCDYWFCY